MSGYNAPPQNMRCRPIRWMRRCCCCEMQPPAAPSQPDLTRCYFALCLRPEPTSLRLHETANGLCTLFHKYDPVCRVLWMAGFGLGVPGSFRRIRRAGLASRHHARRGRAGFEFGTSRSIGNVRRRAGRNAKAMAKKTPARTDGTVSTLHVWINAAGSVETTVRSRARGPKYFWWQGHPQAGDH